MDDVNSTPLVATFMPKRIPLEAILLTVLGLLLAGSLTIAYVDFDASVRVGIARGICVALAALLIVGVIFPARRALLRRDERERRAAASAESADPASRPKIEGNDR